MAQVRGYVGAAGGVVFQKQRLGFLVKTGKTFPNLQISEEIMAEAGGVESTSFPS